MRQPKQPVLMIAGEDIKCGDFAWVDLKTGKLRRFDARKIKRPNKLNRDSIAPEFPPALPRRFKKSEGK